VEARVWKKSLRAYLSFSWSACIQLPLIALAKGRTLDAALEEMSVLYSKELKAAAAAAMGK
jgi:hypothetical protein